MEKALEHFTERDDDDDIVQSILGNPLERSYDKPRPPVITVQGLPTLNDSQQRAVRAAFEHQIISPGTGKTTVAATMAFHFAKCGFRVLMCAPSNIAVDNLLLAVAKTGLKKIVRLNSSRRDQAQRFIGPTSPLEAFVHEYTLARKFDDQGLSGYERKQKEQHYLCHEANVVLCTNIAAGDLRLNEAQFPVIIIDECSQGCEPEALIPVSRASKAARIILLGDSKQLDPVVHCKKIIALKLDTSLFERMATIHGKINLDCQYRMHPAISAFPSFKFYNSELLNGISSQDRDHFPGVDVSNLWPEFDKPIVFIEMDDRAEEMAGRGTTYVNRSERRKLLWVLRRLFSFGAQPFQISVITMYEGQREYLRGYMQSLHTDVLGTELYNSTHAIEAAEEEWPDDDEESNPTMYASDQEDSNEENGMVDRTTEDSSSNDESDSAACSESNFNLNCKLVEINTVDGYQGRENDYIILSTVRSNSRGAVGFLAERRRLNVALTRAKYGLIILGDASTLDKSGVWFELINHYRRNCATIDF